MPDVFAQSMTENPYSAQPPDMWIECTMNKGSKLKSGWKRLLKSEKGLLVHIKNANTINVIRHTIWRSFAEAKRNYSFTLFVLQNSPTNKMFHMYYTGFFIRNPSLRFCPEFSAILKNNNLFRNINIQECSTCTEMQFKPII